MDYFRIRQDRQYLNPPRITNLGDIVGRRLDVLLKNEARISDINVALCDMERVDFPDVLDEQLFLVSDDVRRVFLLYEPAMILKDVCIVNYRNDKYGRYFLPLFEPLDCISERSVVTPDKSFVKKLVLKQPPAEKAVFKIAGLFTDVVVIRLDVAESLLRRGIRHFTLERVPTEESGS